MTTLIQILTIAVATTAISPTIPSLGFVEYIPVQKDLTGTLTSVGADSMLGLFTDLFDLFRSYYPNVKTHVDAQGSGTAIGGLLTKKANFGVTTRVFKPEESKAFWGQFNYEAQYLRIGMDAIVFIVNKENTLSRVTINELDLMITQEETCSKEPRLTTWGELFTRLNVDYPMEFKDREIILAGRKPESGSYSIVRHRIMCDSRYRQSAVQLDTYDEIIQEIKHDKFKIGYITYSYTSDGVKTLAVGESDDRYVLPSFESIGRQDYPISRFSYVYINNDPFGEIDEITRQALFLLFSRAGQEIVSRNRLLSITSSLAKLQLVFLDYPDGEYIGRYYDCGSCEGKDSAVGFIGSIAILFIFLII